MSELYLLNMDVLIDDSLIPFWVHGLLGILGSSLVISTVHDIQNDWLSVNPLEDISSTVNPMANVHHIVIYSINGLKRCL